MWKVEKNPHANAPDRLTVTFPSGFQFNIDNPLVDGLTMLAELVRKGSLLSLSDGQLLYLDIDGQLSVFDVDPWINSDFEFKQVVGNATGLAYTLTNYLKDQEDE